ncbi:hypothetical protein BJ165DRAFT_1609084 [Panaeolus papilionaceus]|nr:hypothetical protein BJ165DRAFT_1609084 [Panaeolus papilionaceus]
MNQSPTESETLEVFRVVGYIRPQGRRVGPTGNYPEIAGRLEDAMYEFELEMANSDETDLDRDGFQETHRLIQQMEVEERVSSVAFISGNGLPGLKFTKAMFTEYKGKHDHFRGECLAEDWWVPSPYSAHLQKMGAKYLVHPLLCYNAHRVHIPAHLLDEAFQDRCVQVEFRIYNRGRHAGQKSGLITLDPLNVLFMEE